MPIPEVHSVGGVLVHMPHVCSVRGVLKLNPKNWLELNRILTKLNRSLLYFHLLKSYIRQSMFFF